MIAQIIVLVLRVVARLVLLVGLLLAIIQIVAFQKIGETTGDPVSAVGPHPYVWAVIFFLVGLLIWAILNFVANRAKKRLIGPA